MSLFERKTHVDVQIVSGVLSVRVRPNPHWLLMLLEAVLIVLFSGSVYRSWTWMSFATRILFLFVEIGSIVGWFYQLSGSELIEFDAQQLRIHKEILGWHKRTELSVQDCTELEIREQGEDHYGLQCKAGWRTIKFGQYLSESQSTEVLTTLQRELPDVAQKAFTSKDSKKHFVTLGLSSQ